MKHITLFLICIFSANLYAATFISGITEPKYDLTISLPVTGRVNKIYVKEGDKVKKGDILVALDHELEKLEVNRRKLILDDNAKLKEIIQREKILKLQWQEAKSLLSNKSMSRKLVEDEYLLYLAAKAERSIMEMSKKREGLELKLAKVALQRRVLKSPIDGVVVKFFFQAGESIAPHEPILRLVDATRARFIGNWSLDSNIVLAKGDTVQLLFKTSLKEVKIKAEIVFVSPVTDASSGLIKVIAEFDNFNGLIKPGVSGQLLLLH